MAEEDNKLTAPLVPTPGEAAADGGDPSSPSGGGAAPSSTTTGRRTRRGRGVGTRPPRSLERVFLTMHRRKMERDLNGPQREKTKYHLVALACMLILVYGLSAYRMNESGEEDLMISLSLGQIVLIGVWILVSIVITSIFGGSRFIVLLYWMLVYWPLLAILASLLFHKETTVFTSEQDWIAISLIVVEIATFLVFVVVNYAYPRFVTSAWFEDGGATWFWNIKMVDCEEEQPTEEGKAVFAMQYDGIWGCLSNRYHCRYVGEVNSSGLPHGQGVWSDDSYNGEILTGTWDDGVPVAPFSSRQYGGKGNTFSAVRLAYFMATDDDWEANKLMPSNDEPARCGVASVECSVAGDFMSHLPDASLVSGEPRVEGEPGGNEVTIGSCCRDLDYGSLQSTSSGPVTSLQISSSDLRGVQIDGFLYAPTGLPFTRRIKEIIVNVTESTNNVGYKSLESGNADGDEESPLVAREGQDGLRLEVKNWMKVNTKDALIFIPGFNSWLKHSLETFGQMMAMTRLGRSVYPVLFAWPGAQVLTYRQASFISGSEKNRRYFLQMLEGLKAEGIQNIHIVTHSLGVQSLMAAFEDSEDGTPSEVSRCFGPAPTHGDNLRSVSDLGGRLVLRSVTMLNPDYPVYAFRERGFRSLRRVASLVTVVGDRADQALFWSSLINGICNSLKWSQPSMCDSEARRGESGFRLQMPIGRNIEELYVGEGSALGNDAHREGMARTSMTARSSSGATERDADKKVWLDCDVVDTTGLDTNVNDLRHSAYNVNSILLRDIEEIIVTGKRASERTTLLHRRGNVYEYCHAPSFVKM